VQFRDVDRRRGAECQPFRGSLGERHAGDQPDVNTYAIAVNTARSSTGRRPPPWRRSFGGGSNATTISHHPSGTSRLANASTIDHHHR